MKLDTTERTWNRRKQESSWNVNYASSGPPKWPRFTCRRWRLTVFAVVGSNWRCPWPRQVLQLHCHGHKTVVNILSWCSRGGPDPCWLLCRTPGQTPFHTGNRGRRELYMTRWSSTVLATHRVKWKRGTCRNGVHLISRQVGVTWLHNYKVQEKFKSDRNMKIGNCPTSEKHKSTLRRQFLRKSVPLRWHLVILGELLCLAIWVLYSLSELIV